MGDCFMGCVTEQLKNGQGCQSELKAHKDLTGLVALDLYNDIDFDLPCTARSQPWRVYSINASKLQRQATTKAQYTTTPIKLLGFQLKMARWTD